jgi:hypothetical protein
VDRVTRPLAVADDRRRNPDELVEPPSVHVLDLVERRATRHPIA